VNNPHKGDNKDNNKLAKEQYIKGHEREKAQLDVGPTTCL